jgi:hypothetical protein
MAPRKTKAETEQTERASAEAITQRGEMVPSGYTFDPRHDPPLYKTEHEQPVGEAGTVASGQPIGDSGEQGGDGDGAD